MDWTKFAVVYCSMVFLAMILCDGKAIPVKSIESPDGDIIDCIHIYDQPAFDHPLLQNHTILTSPSYYPEGVSSGNTGQITQLWQSRGSCPQGTIPVRSIRTKEDLLRNSIKKQPGSFPRLSSSTNPDELTGPHPHEYSVLSANNKYHGGKARINIWQPKVQNFGEFSLAQIWVIAGPYDKLNSVEAGWQVYPSKYSDNNTRLFVYWTSDGYHSHGCYNLDCPGFVQTYEGAALGGAFTPISSYHGPQYDITIMIWKDSAKNAWWLSCQNVTIGYWPASLFSYLADSAWGVQWGGEIVNSKPDGKHTTTEMGSGHFPGEGFGGASFFKEIQVVDLSDKLIPPDTKLGIINPTPTCYNISVFKSDEAGLNFLFGGPGRNPDCP